MGISKAKAALKVLNDFYLVEPFPVEIEVDANSGLTPDVIKALKESKLFVPEAFKSYVEKRPMKGRVVAYGDKCIYANKDIVLGDTIYFGHYCYAKIKHEGKEYLEMREQDILAVDR